MKMTDENKTHYRKAFDSPYLSSADIVEPVILTVARVSLDIDKAKKKDLFNTAYFIEKEIRPGEALKPMILNATNSRTMKGLAGSPFIDDWKNIPVTIYVDNSVRFGKDTVEGLRISTERPNIVKPELTPENQALWKGAIFAYQRDGNFDAVEKKAIISEANKELLKKEAAA
jgi:hypothetical protein